MNLESVFMKQPAPPGFHIYRCTHGKHRLIQQHLQWLNTWFLTIKKNPLNDIEPRSNLYEQVRIAYSVPRTLAMITISDGTKYNLFPLDLHGAVNDSMYACTLREQSKSSAQVEQCRRIVLSEIDCSFKNDIYATAKNHIKEMQPVENFPFSNLRSKNFNLPLPAGCTTYCELQLESREDFGFHRLYFFNVVHRQQVMSSYSSFAHIHRYAAEWRRKNKIPTSNC